LTLHGLLELHESLLILLSVLFVRLDLKHLVLDLSDLIFEGFEFLGVTSGLSLDLADLATDLVLLLGLQKFLVIEILLFFV
jgi:hypothetical protein